MPRLRALTRRVLLVTAAVSGPALAAIPGTTPPADEPNAYTPTACPGGRPPHAWLEDGRSLFDTFHEEWTLLALGPEPPDAKPFTDAARALAVDLRVVRHPSQSLRDLYKAPFALIRPDQIVAWRGDAAHDALRVLRQACGIAQGDEHLS